MATPTIVQQATTIISTTANTDSTDIVYAFPSATTAGNAILVIVPVAVRPSLTLVSGIASDNVNSGPYSLIGQTPWDADTNAYGYSAVFALIKENIAGGTPHVTVEMGNSCQIAFVLEISGAATSRCIDQFSGASAATGTSLSSGSITNRNAHDLIIACGFDFGNSTDTFTATSGFTQYTTQTYSPTGDLADAVIYQQGVSATGTFSNLAGFSHAPKAMHSLIVSISDTSIPTSAILTSISVEGLTTGNTPDALLSHAVLEGVLVVNPASRLSQAAMEVGVPANLRFFTNIVT